MKGRFQDQRAFKGSIRIEAGRNWTLSRGGIPPRRDCSFVKPHSETAAIDQGMVIRTPIADAITKTYSALGMPYGSG